MSDDAEITAVLDPAFFEGRLMIDILSWNWDLRVAISAPSTRRKARFQGVDHSRDFTLEGRLRAPGELRGKTVRVTLSPFGPKLRFGRGGLQHVGALTAAPSGSGPDFEAALMLPEDAIPTTATSLASSWKHLDIWTFDETLQRARVRAFTFSASIHPNLRAWAGED